jgi:hypothetical protein
LLNKKGQKLKITEPKIQYQYGGGAMEDDEDVAIDLRFVNVDEVDLAKNKSLKKARESEVPAVWILMSLKTSLLMRQDKRILGIGDSVKRFCQGKVTRRSIRSKPLREGRLNLSDQPVAGAPVAERNQLD